MLISKTHQCQFCEDVLETYAQFNSHLTKHLEEKRFKCPDTKCNQLFSKFETYLKHTQKEHQIKPKFGCPKCDQVFVTGSRLSLHEFAHTLKVEDKKLDAKHIESKDLALQKHHEIAANFQCFKCKITFSSQKGFDKHMSFVNHDVICPICDRKFASDTIIRRHLKTHLKSDDSNNTVCTFCDKTFKSEFYLKSHKLIHTGDLPFGCDKCNARFNRKDKLKRHSLLHGSAKKFPCPFRENAKCKKEFYRMDKLKSHVKTHGNTKITRCFHCQQIFNSSTILRKHVAEAHTGLTKTIKCFECDETFKLEKQRRIHHEKNHGIIHYIDGTSVKTIPLIGDEPPEIKTSSNTHGEESQQDNIIIYIEAD